MIFERCKSDVPAQVARKIAVDVGLKVQATRTPPEDDKDYREIIAGMGGLDTDENMESEPEEAEEDEEEPEEAEELDEEQFEDGLRPETFEQSEEDNEEAEEEAEEAHEFDEEHNPYLDSDDSKYRPRSDGKEAAFSDSSSSAAFSD